MKTNSDKALAGSGIITAIAASLCCVTPVLALIAGSSGIASAFSWMEPFRPYLIGITALVLGFAWYQKLKPRTAEEIACDCEPARRSGGEDDLTALPRRQAGKKPVMQTKRFLVIVTIFAALMVAFPYYSSIFYTDSKQEVVDVDPFNIQTLDLEIEGMTCQACDSHVAYTAQEVPGVIGVKADHTTGKAVVKFDKTGTTKEAIVNAINAGSYKVINAQEE